MMREHRMNQPTFGAELRRLREQRGLSLKKFAKVVNYDPGYLSKIENSLKPPNTTLAKTCDAALDTGGQLARLVNDHTATRQRRRRSTHPAHCNVLEKMEVTLVVTADESARFLAWAEASNVGELTVEQMYSNLQRIARNYLKVPTPPLFIRARAIRDQVFALLAGHQRPDQSRDLYAVAGWALTLLGWISTDLGRPDAAHTHARAAWVCADNAGHNGLRAWARATQHTAAFWEHRFLDAAHYAQDGLRYANTGSAGAFLASAHALDLAKAGQADDARAALVRARDTAEVITQASDELAGPFTCSVDRAGGFWSDVYLALAQPTAALIEADRAVAVFERTPTPRRNLGSERMARVQQVRAHLALGQFDGAAETLAPVLDTAPEHRVRPLLQRLGEVLEQAAVACGQRSEPALSTLREAITDFMPSSLR